MKHHILFVEDDGMVRVLLSLYLENENFNVSCAGCGKEMLGIFDQGDVDLVLLDLGLPDIDGMTLAKQIRARSTVPIVVLTARKDQEARIAALEIGANDYLDKPCDPRELVLRMQNLLATPGNVRGSQAGSEIDTKASTGPMYFDGWRLDTAGRSLTSPDGDEVSLTSSEFNVLTALANASNRVLSREQLLDSIAREDETPTERAIDVLISRIRRKIEADPSKPRYIITIKGYGYKFTAKVSDGGPNNR